MLELFQSEWCPASGRVRQRLTELGIDYVIRQVPVERAARAALRDAVGADTIPALRLENGSAIVGKDDILAYLRGHVGETAEAGAHRQKAANMRRRYLADECESSRPATRRARWRRPAAYARTALRTRTNHSRVPQTAPGRSEGRKSC
jgi:glutathione S-transferase